MDLVSYSVELVSRSGAGFEQTTLSAHDWRVRALELREYIDEPFSLDLTMISDDIDLDVEGLVGASVSVTIAGTDLERIVRGVVTTAQYLGTFDHMVQMRLGVRPSLALADLFERSRVFQALSVPEIVTAVATEHLGEHGSVDSAALTATDYPPRDYCVQFRETDLAFITRILAEEGIASVLHQSQDDAVDEQTLVLTDATPSFRAVPLATDDPQASEPPVIPVVTDRAQQADTACVTAMAWRRTTMPAGHRARTFDWKAPTRGPIETVAETEDRAPWEHGEVFRHSDRRTIEDGDEHLDATERITKALRQRAQTQSALAVGQSNALGFFAGGLFTLDGHPGKTLDRTYLLTHVMHRADCPEADLRAGGSVAGVNYGNR
ncbi:MAG: hypothetical protein JKY37_16550, partial [Nannocystaceae bacterium]|nr:hypothetical protein [Nannocystaceae bacterium]